MTTKTKRVRKAWILLYGNLGVRPTILWSRPNLDERRDAEERGFEILPCSVTYTLPRPTSKVSRKKTK